MSLKEKLASDIKTCMKSGNKERLQFVRTFHAAIRKKEVYERIDLDDSGVIGIAVSQLKQRQESLTQFEKGGRADLVAKEKSEIAFLQEFLPKQLSEQELSNLVSEAIKATSAQGIKDMGKVMQCLMPKVQGKCDGKKLSDLVKAKLVS